MLHCHIDMSPKQWQALICVSTHATMAELIAIILYSQGQSPQVVSVLCASPTQYFPPLAGGGLSHVLTRKRIPPPPQVTEQFESAVQGDQPPSTE